MISSEDQFRPKNTTQIYVYYAAMIFVLLGSLNWGLIGAFNFNIVLRGSNQTPFEEEDDGDVA